MDSIRFSVVIPVYKAEKYIKKCLDSVINQSYKAYEIIIVNDGSPDNCDEIIKAYIKEHPDNEFKYLNQVNQGPAIARGKGIELCTGDYVAFLDADDIWYPDKLEVVKQYIQTKNTDMYYSDEVEVKIDGTRRKLEYGEIEGDPIVYLLQHGNQISTSTCVVKTEILKQNHSFYDGIKYCEDFACWISLLNSGASIVHIPQSLGEYIRNSDSLTISDMEFMRKTADRLLDFYDLLKDRGYSSNEIDILKEKQQSRNDYNLARLFHMNSDYGNAIIYYKKALSKRWNIKAILGLSLAYIHVNI